MKDRKTYKILTACSFILPINRWYLGNGKGAIGRSISANYLLMGWLGDLFYMDKTFEKLWQSEASLTLTSVTSKVVS